MHVVLYEFEPQETGKGPLCAEQKAVLPAFRRCSCVFFVTFFGPLIECRREHLVVVMDVIYLRYCED